MDKMKVFVAGAAGAVLAGLVLLAMVMSTGMGGVAEAITSAFTNSGPRGAGEVSAYRCDENVPPTPSDVRSVYTNETGQWIPPQDWHRQSPACAPYMVPDGSGGMMTITPDIYRTVAEVSIPEGNPAVWQLVWGIPHEAGGSGPPGPQGPQGDEGPEGPQGPVDPTLSGRIDAIGTTLTRVDAQIQVNTPRLATHQDPCLLYTSPSPRDS